MKTRILLVDDDRGTRTVLLYTLENFGYEVVEAGSIAEARSLLGVQPFDWLISDFYLPDGLGTRLLQEELESRPNTRGLLMSAGRNPGGHSFPFWDKMSGAPALQSAIEGVVLHTP